MTMRGLEALIPAYERSLLVPEDLAFWEAVYDDGHVVMESYGGSYKDLDRDRITSFRIIYGGEIVFEMFLPPGVTGRNLVYRRRTALGQSGAGRAVRFVLGWYPMGPAYVVNISAGSYRVRPEGFAPSKAEDAEFYIQALTPEEADYLTDAS